MDIPEKDDYYEAWSGCNMISSGTIISYENNILKVYETWQCKPHERSYYIESKYLTRMNGIRNSWVVLFEDFEDEEE